MLRRKDGVTELLELAATLPWKVVVGVASVSFAACFAAAELTDDPAAEPALLWQFVHDGATVFEFLLPAALLVVAAVSGLRRAWSNALFHAAQADPETTLPALSQQAFERLIARGFRQRGFAAQELGGSGRHGGIDLLISKEQKRFLVRCAQERHIGVSAVRDLHGAMAAENVDGAYLVTCGSFSDDAKEFVAGRDIELFDRRRLSALLREGRASMRRPQGWVSARA